MAEDGIPQQLPVPYSQTVAPEHAAPPPNWGEVAGQDEFPLDAVPDELPVAAAPDEAPEGPTPLAAPDPFPPVAVPDETPDETPASGMPDEPDAPEVLVAPESLPLGRPGLLAPHALEKSAATTEPSSGRMSYRVARPVPRVSSQEHEESVCLSVPGAIGGSWSGTPAWGYRQPKMPATSGTDAQWVTTSALVHAVPRHAATAASSASLT
jgi:hypothetical protein